MLQCSSRFVLCSGSRELRSSGSGHVRCSLCSQVLPGSRDVRGSDLCGSGSGEVLRHRLRDQVLHCRSLRSCTLDL